MCATKRRYRTSCGLSAAVAAVRVPTYCVGAFIGRPGARPSAVRATRRPLAEVSIIGGKWAAIACQARRGGFAHGCWSQTRRAFRERELASEFAIPLRRTVAEDLPGEECEGPSHRPQVCHWL